MPARSEYQCSLTTRHSLTFWGAEHSELFSRLAIETVVVTEVSIHRKTSRQSVNVSRSQVLSDWRSLTVGQSGVTVRSDRCGHQLGPSGRHRFTVGRPPGRRRTIHHRRTTTRPPPRRHHSRRTRRCSSRVNDGTHRGKTQAT